MEDLALIFSGLFFAPFSGVVQDKREGYRNALGGQSVVMLPSEQVCRKTANPASHLCSDLVIVVGRVLVRCTLLTWDPVSGNE